MTKTHQCPPPLGERREGRAAPARRIKCGLPFSFFRGHPEGLVGPNATSRVGSSRVLGKEQCSPSHSHQPYRPEMGRAAGTERAQIIHTFPGAARLFKGLTPFVSDWQMLEIETTPLPTHPPQGGGESRLGRTESPDLGCWLLGVFIGYPLKPFVISFPDHARLSRRPHACFGNNDRHRHVSCVAEPSAQQARETHYDI